MMDPYDEYGEYDPADLMDQPGKCQIDTRSIHLDKLWLGRIFQFLIKL